MHESGENYLETILILKERKGTVRSIDIARELNFSKPSVSLREDGFIEMEPSGGIILTPEGLAKAEAVYGRHRLLTAFLQEVTGVPKEQAEANACRMEHILDQDVVDGINRYMIEREEKEKKNP